MHAAVKELLDACNEVIVAYRNRAQDFEAFRTAEQRIQAAKIACKAADTKAVAKARKNLIHHIVLQVEGVRLGLFVDEHKARKFCDDSGLTFEWLQP